MNDLPEHAPGIAGAWKWYATPVVVLVILLILDLVGVLDPLHP